MNIKLVRCLGYYGGTYVTDLLKRACSEDLWEEVRKSDEETFRIEGLRKMLMDVNKLRDWLMSVDCASDLYDQGIELQGIGSRLEQLATGSRWEEFKELEDFAFLLQQVGDVIQAFTLELDDDNIYTEAFIDSFVDLMVLGHDTIDQRILSV